MDLKQFSQSENFLVALKAFFKALNVPINYVADEPTNAREILKECQKYDQFFEQMDDVYFLGMVDDRAFGNPDLRRSESEIREKKEDYPGILIFGVTLVERPNCLLPTRSQLAEISRAFNREFKYTPVVVVFKYENYLAFANTERLKYKQEWREGEKAGKVSLLRDIDIENTHSGHERILAELQIPKKGKKEVDSFEKLYAYWQEVFSVSLLNKKFYEEISNWYFWAIKHVTFPNKPSQETVVAKYGKYDQNKLDEMVNEHKATNVIRLLTRLLFVWFMKEKKLIPDELFDLKALQKEILKQISPERLGGLFPEANLDSIYYKAILQNLFFATLNCPIEEDHIDKRKRGFRGDGYGAHRGIDYLMRYKKYFKEPEAFLDLVNKTVPFLNGGLFECLDDKYQNQYIDGFSDQMTKGEQLIVPDYLFFGVSEKVDLSHEYGKKTKKFKEAAVKGLINILESYKFTINENTPIEEDVALDPELLGKVFENLLASYNPETKTTARKQTGSFYTPREIVNYMVDESLIAYLKNRISNEPSVFVEFGKAQANLFGNEGNQGQQTLMNDVNAPELKDNPEKLDEILHELVSFNTHNPLKNYPNTSKHLLRYLNECTILDPACGSGAFPMGILQKMVHILQKIDPDNKAWQDVQEAKAKKEAEQAFDIDDKETRNDRLNEISEAFDQSINDPDYARKLFLIENCIYGVDIQPIATQISKLRFFISLVVEQKVNPDKPNFGIRPLPNLETKFVTANTLIGIEKPKAQYSMFETGEVKQLEKELKIVRHKLFSARTKETKLKYRKKDEELRNAIGTELKENGWPSDTAEKLAGWDPYDQNASSSFFDPEWMFDMKDGFDVVIGNPPYGVSIKGNDRKEVSKYLNKVPDYEIYYFFIEIAHKIVSENGCLCYIVPNTYLFNVFAENYRNELINNWGIKLIIDFTNYSLFDTATVRNSVFVFVKGFETVNVEYLPTKNIDLSLENFIAQRIETLNISLLKEFSQNWALAFKLPQNKINAVANIKKNSKTLKYYFPEISQGLIAYDKYQGQSEVIIDSRAYHYSTFRDGLKKWMWGEDIRKYSVNWNGKEYVDYCSGIANPRQPKFFKGKRMLVREITNPSIFAAITNEELYNDPALLIVLDSNYCLEAATMILNSCVGTFFHFNASPKATKGDFPKILVKDIKEFPLPKEFQSLNAEMWVNIYWITTFANKENYNVEALFLVIDAICLNLYFPDHMAARSIDVLEFVEGDIDEVMQKHASSVSPQGEKFWEFEKLSDTEKEQVIEALYTKWSDPNNEVVKRMGMFKEKSPDILKVILES